MIRSFCICGQRIRCETELESALWNRVRTPSVASHTRRVANPPVRLFFRSLKESQIVPSSPHRRLISFLQTPHAQRVQRAMRLNSDSMDDPEE